MDITSLFPCHGKRVCCKINAFGERKTGRWFRRITSLAASVYSDALCYPALQDSESNLPSLYRRGYCGQTVAGKQETSGLTEYLGESPPAKIHDGFARLPLLSMVLFGGVGGFFAYPSGQVRKCRPASGFFASCQTFMPEFDQPPFLHRQI